MYTLNIFRMVLATFEPKSFMGFRREDFLVNFTTPNVTHQAEMDLGLGELKT